ncbi:RNA-directed DNA polymerase, eukaryota [Tanacetum coccineum]
MPCPLLVLGNLSQFQSLKEEMHEMRNKYQDLRDNHDPKNHMNNDTPMCERHEANYIQYEDYQNQDSHNLFSRQSHYDPNDSEKFAHRINNGFCQIHGRESLSADFRFPSRLTADQISDLEKPVSSDEIRKAVWSCGENKSPGPDGFTFEFFRKYWDSIGPDMCVAVEWFFRHNSFAKGCNASFITLIPKSQDPKTVSDFRPISLIGSLYKVVMKILAIRLSSVISDLISDVQTAFLPNRQILDGPFIINELLSWCRHKKQQAMVFKVDFAKAYDSVRWDYLDDVLFSFGFGVKWRSWIKGSLISGMAYVLVNGSPTSEFQFHGGLKQWGSFGSLPLRSLLWNLPFAVSRTVEAGISLINTFRKAIASREGGCLRQLVNEAAAPLVVPVMKAPFRYLGVMVGFFLRCNMSKDHAWEIWLVRLSLGFRSEGKINTLYIGGRSVTKGSFRLTPIYPMSFTRKISWVKWTKVLASKKYGGLGVSSFYALNRALLFRWVWRFLSHDNSLWFRFISAMHGSSFQTRSSFHCSNWLSIIREVSALKLQGIDFLSHCKRRVGSGMQTRFWEDLWLGEQLENIQDLVRSKVLSNVDDRWAWDLNGDGDFCVKDARDLVDEVLLPKENVATRWIKTIPIKVNVFAWKLHLDRLPTRSNLLKRGIQVQSSLCPICNVLQEDTSHLFFSCDVALDISRLICRWWNVSWSPVDSYSGWLEWFNSIRLGSKLKGILEGVFYVSWWCLWNFRNQLLFASKKPRKETLFDDVVSRSFIWSNSRCNLKFTWDCWLQHPYLIAL